MTIHITENYTHHYYHPLLDYETSTLKEPDIYSLVEFIESLPTCPKTGLKLLDFSVVKDGSLNDLDEWLTYAHDDKLIYYHGEKYFPDPVSSTTELGAPYCPYHVDSWPMALKDPNEYIVIDIPQIIFEHSGKGTLTPQGITESKTTAFKKTNQAFNGLSGGIITSPPIAMLVRSIDGGTRPAFIRRLEHIDVFQCANIKLATIPITDTSIRLSTTQEGTYHITRNS